MQRVDDDLSDLPTEILSIITSYLSTRDDVRNLGKTNKILRNKVRAIMETTLLQVVNAYGLELIIKQVVTEKPFTLAYDLMCRAGGPHIALPSSSSEQAYKDILNKIYDKQIKPAFDKYGNSQNNKFFHNSSLAYWVFACRKGIEAIRSVFKGEMNLAFEHALFYFEQFDIVEKLITEDDIPVDLDIHGWTALHYACQKVNLDAIKMLIKLGANVNQLCNHHFGYMLNYRYISDPHTEMSPLLFLIQARATEKSLEAIQFLLDNGANIEKCDSMNYLPIHRAVQANNIEAVKLLWERQPIPDKKLINLLLHSENDVFPKMRRYGVIGDLISCDAANLKTTMNRAIYTDQPSREALEKSLDELNRFIKSNAATSGELFADSHHLIEQLNSTDVDIVEKFRCITQYKEKYESTSVGKIVVTVAIAAVVAIGCAVAGALIAGAMMSWSGPGAVMAAFVGLLKGAAFGWAHGAVIAASVTGAAVGGSLAGYGSWKAIGLFSQHKSPVTEMQHERALSVVDAANTMLKVNQHA